MKKITMFIKKVKIIIFICILILCLPNIYILRYIRNSEKVIAKTAFSDTFTIMSYNIRCWTLLDIGGKSWFYRAGLVLKNIKSVDADIIGFQEVTPIQYKYLQKKLIGFRSVIEYRNGVPWSEGNPIFFNKNKYELIEMNTFWLSESPEKMSKGWDASNYRICSYIVLSDKATNLKMAVFNTHLDHKSEEARIQSIKVIQDKMKNYEEMPVILMGDFNTTKNSESYLNITEDLQDTSYYARDDEAGSTFQNWGKITEGSPIDYIMVSRNDFIVKSYSVYRKNYNGVYPSDHYPIYVELKMDVK